jgi:molybdopterin converting factor small subunit
MFVQIHLLYFGILKDLFGGERDTLELADGSRVEDAIRLLRGRASNRQDHIWASVAVAVNREYAATSTILHDSDVVALLPPVSGGTEKV